MSLRPLRAAIMLLAAAASLAAVSATAAAAAPPADGPPDTPQSLTGWSGGSDRWDPRGRLWVVEGHSYPTKRPEGQGLDQIVILADQNGDGTTHILRNGHFWNQANAGYPPFICREPPPFTPALKNFLPAAARYDSGKGGAGKKGTDAVYGGHSHAGTMVYLGDNWPEIYRDRIFTHNLHGRQLNHQEAVRQGSGYEVFHAGHDILHVPDETYVAVDLQYGPDGGVYVIDWSDRQHCHNPATEIWDRTNGRLYRVAWAETFRPMTVNLAAKTDAELVGLHTHRNEWFIRTARRLLQERAAAGTLDLAVLEPLRHGDGAGRRDRGTDHLGRVADALGDPGKPPGGRVPGPRQVSDHQALRAGTDGWR